MRLIWVAIVVLAHTVATAQYVKMRMDTVIEFMPGGGPTLGRGPAFFPMNVLQGPAPEATDTTPSVNGREICSIGLDGSIVLGLKQHVVVDGPGADIIIFENAFVGPRGKLFAEPGAISVSKDMITWYDFPFDSASLHGCAGVTPTSGADPFDASVSGGDAFDLFDVGADSIRYIKIRDVTRIVSDNPKHQYYDPTLTGFDLDVVTTPHAVRIATSTGLQLIPRTSAIEVSVETGTGLVSVYDVHGFLLEQYSVPHGVTELQLRSVVNSCIIVILESNQRAQMVKVLR